MFQNGTNPIFIVLKIRVVEFYLTKPDHAPANRTQAIHSIFIDFKIRVTHFRGDS